MDARSAIEHGCDGPITQFVLIHRAIQLAKRSSDFDAETIANVLYEAMLERGFISTAGDEAYSEGS